MAWKTRCKYCRARHRPEFMLHFADKSVCHECACEYRKMFFDYKNRDQKRLEERFRLLGYKFNKIKRIDDGISEDS